MVIDELKESMVRGAMERTGASRQEVERILAPALEQLQEEWGGERIRINVPRRKYPVEAIRKAVEEGESVRAICATYHIDRRMLYRLLDDPA